MKKELCFRREAYGNGVVAQRDKVKYEVKYSAWYEGKSTSTPGILPYHVARWDTIKKDYVSTENVKRFATEDEAKAFCQDLYDGKIDLAALRVEIQTEIDRRERETSEHHHNSAERFKEVLRNKSISLSDFLEVIKTWNDTTDTGRSLLYQEVKGGE